VHAARASPTTPPSEEEIPMNEDHDPERNLFLVLVAIATFLVGLSWLAGR
jgi:hypothetical protein